MHLVSPVFHGYWKAIATSLELRGHTVSTHTYDSHTSIGGRTWHKLRHQLPHKLGAGSLRRLARDETARAVAAVVQARPDAVVVIKGDTLQQPFWDAITGIPRITWLYDEVRRTRWTIEGLAVIGPVATYSALDASAFSDAGLNSRHLPLAFDHRLVPSPMGGRRADVTFVGARYPSREEVLTRLHDHGVPVRAYGRDWSGHPVDRLRTWRLGSPGVPAARDLTRAAAYAVMSASTATLNMHGDQDGFTMRTFEASGVGGLQIVDRTDLEGLYEPGVELVNWKTLDDLVELCRRAEADPRWSAAIRDAGRARTLAEHTFDHRVTALEDAWDTA